jgi:hypothetical protein
VVVAMHSGTLSSDLLLQRRGPSRSRHYNLCTSIQIIVLQPHLTVRSIVISRIDRLHNIPGLSGICSLPPAPLGRGPLGQRSRQNRYHSRPSTHPCTTQKIPQSRRKRRQKDKPRPPKTSDGNLHQLPPPLCPNSSTQPSFQHLITARDAIVYSE